MNLTNSYILYNINIWRISFYIKLALSSIFRYDGWTGRNSKGVSVYLYADVLLRLAELHQVDVCWLVVYKVRFNLVDFG